MAKAGKTSMGTGSQGKGDGSGAMTELPEGVLPENMVLSNRDKSSHGDERGLDSRQVQTEQYHDHSANRRNFDAEEQPMPGSGESVSGTPVAAVNDEAEEDNGPDEPALGE